MNAAIAGILFTVAGTAVCAIAQLTGKIAAEHIPTAKMCAIRYGLAIPMGYIAMVALTHRWLPAMDLRQIIITSIISLISWGLGAILFFSAMKKDGMHRVAPISNSLSIWAAVLSILFLGEPFFPALAAVLVILIFGIALMAPASESGRRWRWAIPASVLVSILWALSIVQTKMIIHGIGYSDFVFVKMFAATAFHSVFWPSSKGTIERKGIWFVAISSATLVGGDILLMAGVDRLPASVFSPVFATVIPFGFIGSVLFLGEKPLRRNWMGMALIFLAAAICGYYGAK